MWAILMPIILRGIFYILAIVGIGAVYKLTISQDISKYYWLIALVCFTVILYSFFKGYWDYKKAKLIHGKKDLANVK